jgi:hypothetical protein
MAPDSRLTLIRSLMAQGIKPLIGVMEDLGANSYNFVEVPYVTETEVRDPFNYAGSFQGARQGSGGVAA